MKLYVKPSQIRTLLTLPLYLLGLLSPYLLVIPVLVSLYWLKRTYETYYVLSDTEILRYDDDGLTHRVAYDRILDMSSYQWFWYKPFNVGVILIYYGDIVNGEKEYQGTLDLDTVRNYKEVLTKINTLMDKRKPLQDYVLLDK